MGYPTPALSEIQRMAPPTIALRFRDTTPHVDTIAAHGEILQREGAVWWGWWKKDFEDSDDDFLAKLFASEKSIDILIVDRSTERTFLAVCNRWVPPGEQVDPGRVPEYYRDQISKVFGWFLLVSIESVKYHTEIANRFGDKTFLLLSGNFGPAAEKAASRSGDLGKSCVLHLSDLHFGDDYAYLTQGEKVAPGELRRTLTERLLEDIARIDLAEDIAALVVTGDFMSRGNWDDGVRFHALSEFKALQDALSIAPGQIFVVPGNHDIVRYPKDAEVDIATIAVDNQTTFRHEREFRTFADELIGRSWKEPLNYVYRIQLKNVDLLICLLNSCRIVATQWTEYGFVGNNGLDAIEQLKAEDIERPTFKFVALHHHLLPVAEVEAPKFSGVSLSLDASKLLDAAQDAGVHVALHGHQHIPKIARYQTIPLMGANASQPLYVISNGSTGAVQARLPGNERNTYCAFRLSDDGIELWMREIRPDGKEGTTLYQGALGVVPELTPS